MDILVSSNLERVLFELLGRDDKRITGLFADLKKSGVYKIKESERKEIEKIFYAGYADEEITKQTIAKFFDDYDYLLDPHTAVAAAVYKKYQGITFDDTKTIIMSTAHPYKFASAVYEAVMQVVEPDAFRAAEELNDISALPVPKSIACIKNKKRLHTKTIKKEEIKMFIREFIK
jgi:threonine synthase